MDLLQYAFFQNALIGSLLTAIACGIVGLTSYPAGWYLSAEGSRMLRSEVWAWVFIWEQTRS